jgi:putative tryptophan/tyrosine transport system substrate-binding protein
MKRRQALAALCTTTLFVHAARGQQPGRVYRVGFLVQASGAFLLDALLAALREQGWGVGRNLQIETRLSGAGATDIGALAKELVAARCDLIVVAGTHMALAAKQATSTIPIVMYVSGWPVEGGLVASYARPGGNITGLSTYGGSEKIWTKFMSLTAELLPSLREIGVIWDYVAPLFLEKEVEYGVGELTRAAELLKVRSRTWAIHKQGDMEDALKAMAGAPMQALFATSGPYISQPQNWPRISEIAVRRRLPIICDIAGSTFRNMGLLAYSVNWNEAARRCASFVDRILRGAKPGELPIEQPTNFELVLHAGRAKAIGLTIPPAMLIRADRVIE